MSERLSSYGSRAVAVVAATVALAGCTEAARQPEQLANAPAFSRCLDKPLPDERNEQSNPYVFAETINLHYDSRTRHITEVPQARPAIDRKLAASTVKILSGPSGYGSGFVVGGKVITAAHVINTNSLDMIQIQDRSGVKVNVKSGCYIYENKGEFSPLNDPSIQEYDIAVLQPADALDAASLPLAKQNPERGSWIRFANNQLDTSPAHPHRYAGLVATSTKNPQGITAITGLEPFRSSDPADYTAHGGASGGVVGNPQTGAAEGMVIGSTIGNGGSKTTCAARGVTTEMLGVTFNASATREHGVCPVEANIVGAVAIRQALAALPHHR